MSSAKYQEPIVLVAKFDYKANEVQELDLRKGERLLLLDSSRNWWQVQKFETNQIGYIPSNYVKKEKKSILDKILPKRTKFKSQESTDSSHSKSYSEQTLSRKTTKAIVKHKYVAKKSDELTLTAGSIINVVNKYEDGWWRVESEGNYGLFPSNHLEEYNENDFSNPKIIHNTSFDNSNDKLNDMMLLQQQHQYHVSAAARHSNDETINLSSNNIKSDSFSSTEKDIEYVRIMYAYRAQCDNELNVNINDVLKIIDDEIVDYDDNLWIRCMDCYGNYGLIPSKCVEPVLETNIVFMRKPANRGLFANIDWYFGGISRYETNILLNKYGKNGDFLVRDSEQDSGNFSISLKSDNINNKHFKVIFKDNQFIIGKKLFHSMHDLIENYRKYPIFDQNSEKLYLIKPFSPP